MRLSQRNAAAARVVEYMEGRGLGVSDEDLAEYILLQTGSDDPLARRDGRTRTSTEPPAYWRAG